MSTERQYIARISYGKDSLKMLEVIHSRGLPLDRITTTDVWATDTISANLPPMQEFKDRMDQRIWDMYHIQVEHLCALNPDGTKKTYEQMFYHVPVRKCSQSVQVERERERETRVPGSGINHRISPKHQIQLVPEAQNLPRQQSRDFLWQLELHGVRSSKSGCRPQGFPAQTSMVSKAQDRQGQNPFLPGPTRRARRNIVEYLGIAADEPDRFGQLNDRKRAPLVEYGIEEDLCGLYCQYSDMLAPTYETSCRDGCWFCHNQGIPQLRHLRKNYPDLWALLLKWDLDSPVTFKADGHTVHDFDRRFQMEDDGVVPIDNTFRWEPISSGQISFFDLMRNDG